MARTIARLTDNESAAGEGQVWDVFLRLFHWLLVVTIGVSWLTAELGVEYREYHFYSGYCAFGLMVFRLLWGLLGPAYARFGHFLRGPSGMLAYLRARLGGEPPPETYPGHNPLGALAVVLLLLVVTAQVITGLFADDDILYTGPWREAISSALADELTGWHHTNFNLLLGLVVLHLVAIVFYRVRLGEFLTIAMLNGRKQLQRFGEYQPLIGVPWVRALLAIAVAVVSVWLMLEMAPEPVYEDWY